MPQQTGLSALPPVLAGRKALVIGVANDRSIAWGCAEAMRLVGIPPVWAALPVSAGITDASMFD